MEALERRFADARPDRLDGLRLDWPDRWLLVRASNTEPIVRAIAEAPTAAAAEELCAEAREVAAASGEWRVTIRRYLLSSFGLASFASGFAARLSGAREIAPAFFCFLGMSRLGTAALLRCSGQRRGMRDAGLGGHDHHPHLVLMAWPWVISTLSPCSISDKSAMFTSNCVPSASITSTGLFTVGTRTLTL